MTFSFSNHDTHLLFTEGVTRSSSLPSNLRVQQTTNQRKTSSTLPSGTQTIQETNIDSGTTVNHKVKKTSDTTSQSSLRGGTTAEDNTKNSNR